jgi:hypothetical protein
MIVKVKIQNGTRTADIQEGISWSLVREIDANTWEISAPEYEAELGGKALKKVVDLFVKEKFDTLSEKDKGDLIPLFADGHDDDIKVEGGKLVKKIKDKK